jgi:hypothetical protein
MRDSAKCDSCRVCSIFVQDLYTLRAIHPCAHQIVFTILRRPEIDPLREQTGRDSIVDDSNPVRSGLVRALSRARARTAKSLPSLDHSDTNSAETTGWALGYRDLRVGCVNPSRAALGV